MSATCRSCSAAIVWAKSAAGRPMPLDATPEKRVVVENGVGRIVDAYVSHFSTCPHSARHRKRTTAAERASAKETDTK